jgi:hypothetical protein
VDGTGLEGGAAAGGPGGALCRYRRADVSCFVISQGDCAQILIGDAGAAGRVAGAAARSTAFW